MHIISLALAFLFTLTITAATPIPAAVEPRLDLSTTRNGLKNGVCKAVTVIFARGTFEAGNVGLLAGPPFFDALQKLIGSDNLAVQGVDYAASLEGYLEGGDPEGANTTASLVNLAASKCPNTQIVLSGYSQGAQVIHLAVKTASSSTFTPITTSALEKVAAVVLFGDPDEDQSLPGIAESDVETFCAKDDLICDGLPIPLPAHLSYADDADNAAEFVEGKISL
ncbi:putative cutinase precursor [Phaeomoniella chlamydospora]|uniref:Cutinase n=1 Tax=Phaeomoniella chlamydospora TaxID=158046 RepID=A0A0G2FUW3_PHACM|nr:putative cutinase precursor [Phaeomoniella chlamydospora]